MGLYGPPNFNRYAGKAVNVETITTTNTLSTADYVCQRLTPSGANCNVVLPPVASSQGRFFHIANPTGTSYSLVVKKPNGSTTLATLTTGTAAEVACDGADWYVTLLGVVSASGYMLATGATTGATAVAQPFTNGTQQNTVDELTAAAGVTVDGCLIKDGKAAVALLADVATLANAATGPITAGALKTVKSVNSADTTITVGATDVTIVGTKSGDQTITLPSATGTGRILICVNQQGGTKVMTLHPVSSQTINGSTADVTFLTGKARILQDVAAGAWVLVGGVF